MGSCNDTKDFPVPLTSKIVNVHHPATGNFIHNKFGSGRGTLLSLVNPKDGGKISIDVHSASEDDVNNAVHSAREAFASGPWSKWTGAQRSRVLSKLADLIDENKEAVAYLESLCTGRPLGMLLGEIPRVSNTFRYYAGWADKIKGDSYPAENGFYKIVRREPLGVCCGITAWNASLLFCSWKSAPALAAGNTVILKPSEKSPLGSLAIASLVESAGFPPGVFQVVIGGGDVGSMLSKHMGIDKISFTGSTRTGKLIQNAATNSNLKRVTLELGGKSPAIVFDDADLDKALFWTTIGITVNSGQVCAATSRLLIQNSVAEPFLAKLKAGFESIARALGDDPQDLSTKYGPLVDEQQYKKVWQYIHEGKKTSKCLTGGDEYTNGGFYVPPTVFMEPDTKSSIWTEEIFGPVLCVRTFETEEEAIALANDSEYGLSGAIFTQNVGRALRLSSSVRAGTICVNCNLMVGDQAPMGGFGLDTLERLEVFAANIVYRSSGIGRELGEAGLAQYTETKTVWIGID